MGDTTSRTLDLLSLLQSHRNWACRELAERLGVSERTLRRDIERLRDLGYEIEATRGSIGGYRLTAGTGLPPLLLTDDEAVAIAIGLRSQATAGLRDAEHTTLSALAKVEQVLPAALRRRIAAMQTHVSAGSAGTTPADAPVVDTELLGLLALCCRDSERLRFHYTDGHGVDTVRSVEPHMLVPQRGRWYLVAWDRDREDWRTFRLDRVSRPEPTRVAFEPRPMTATDAAERVRRATRFRESPVSATAIIDAPLAEVQAALRGWGRTAYARDDGRTAWPLTGESVHHVIATLVWIPNRFPYELDGPPELLAEAASIGLALAGRAS